MGGSATPQPTHAPLRLRPLRSLVQSRPAAVLWKYALLPCVMGLVGMVIVTRITGWFHGPNSYKIVFAAKLSEPSIKQLYAGLEAGLAGRKLAIAGVPVVLDEQDDQGDPEKAVEVARRLARRNDTLAVVGHVYSTQSKAALPVYLQDNPPVPVLLTTETNPDLLPPRAPSESYEPVFRLSATDEIQAATAAAFAVGKLNAKSFWVVQDSDNAAYSRFLAFEFIKAVQKLRRSVVLSTTVNDILPPEALRDYRIDCVFFAGEWFKALVLVRQVRRLSEQFGITPPTVILSDWCAVNELTEQGGADLQGVYLTHPRRADEVNQHGYEYYGRDAAALLGQLIDEANKNYASVRTQHSPVSYWVRRILNMHRVADARDVIATVMERAVLARHQFTGMPSKEQYQFNDTGALDDARFHVWQVRDQQFVPVE